MLKIDKFFVLIVLSIYQVLLNADLLDDQILIPINNANKSCMVYQPYLGVVDDIESLDIRSDKFEITDQKALILNGNVEVDFPEGLLKSGKARIDQDNESISFKKKGDLFLKDYFFRANSGLLNRNDSSIYLQSGKAFINARGLLVNFDQLKGDIDGEIIIDRVSMTSCSDTKKGWELIADKIVLKGSNNRGYAKSVKIKAFDKTIINFPIIPFATSQDRMSGFLEPNLSYSSDGLDFMIPYYKVISDKADITTALRNISERGFGFEGNIRNLHGEGNNLRNIDYIYFTKDKEYSRIYPNQSNSRWAFAIKDSFGDKNKLWVDVNWAKASDSLVLSDMPGEITSLGSQREQRLNQNISINSIFKDFYIVVSKEGYQTLNPVLTNGYKKNPALDIKYLKNFKKFSIYEHFNFTDFRASDLHGFFGNQVNGKYKYLINDPVEGSRVFYDFKITNFSTFNGFKIMTSLGVRNISYNLNNKEHKTKSVTAPNFKIDISTSFMKKEDKLLHIIKPRILYGFVDYKNQTMNPVFDSNRLNMMNQLFNNERFVGMDRIGDQNFYTISLEYKKRKMNMDRLSLKISQKFYLENKKVFLDDINLIPMSNMMQNLSEMNSKNSMFNKDKDNLMIMGKWMPNMKTMTMFYGGYSQDVKKYPMAGLSIDHKFKNGRIAYAKRYTKMAGDFNKELDYSEFFTDIRLKDNLSIFATIKRDDDSGIKIDSSFGIGFENCCFNFRIVTSDKNLSRYLNLQNSNSYIYLNEAWDNIITIENKSRISFEFEFKGLNSGYKKMNRFINNSIFSY